MTLSAKEIEYIANLARLELTPDEIERYGRELSAVLGYVEQLQDVNTDNILPCAQVTGQENIWREDEAKPWNEAEVKIALDQAAAKRNGQVEVRRVL